MSEHDLEQAVIKDTSPSENDNENQKETSSLNIKSGDRSGIALIHQASPATVILQWLTYVFWGWTIIALSLLFTATLSSFIIKEQAGQGEFSLYAIAALLILLPISIACDIIYSKREPAKKIGASSIAMIINSVIFALVCIGSIITALFSLVRLLITGSGLESSIVVMSTGLITAFLLALLLTRVLAGEKMKFIKKYFILIMLIIVGIGLIASITGPVAQVWTTRSDKFIENNLSDINSGVEYYVKNNNKLPDSLKEVKLAGDSKKIVDDGLVDYKKNTKPSGFDFESPSMTHYYQLCVKYSKEKEQENRYRYGDNDGYQNGLYVYGHPAGEVCYKLKVYGPNNEDYYLQKQAPTPI